MHAKSGGDIEIMGLMQGRILGHEMVVTDAFALPVEGTETRVNAAIEGYEYMVQYTTQIKQVGKMDNVVGWYHSHPGYGCWLSGIDVSTQMLNQTHQEPFLAIVVRRSGVGYACPPTNQSSPLFQQVDPHATISAGKVEIGAFRTYPEVIGQNCRHSSLGANLNAWEITGIQEQPEQAVRLPSDSAEQD